MLQKTNVTSAQSDKSQDLLLSQRFLILGWTVFDCFIHNLINIFQPRALALLKSGC